MWQIFNAPGWISFTMPQSFRFLRFPRTVVVRGTAEQAGRQMPDATGKSIEAGVRVTSRAAPFQMSTPWLSVVMPTYNGGATLEQSLDSLCGQDDGIEVVIVDQGSTDGSSELAMRYADRLRIRHFSKPDHTNWVQNTNFGILQADAPLVTMLHQDDVWFKGRARVLRRLLAAAPHAALWVHAAAYLDAGSRRIGVLSPPFGRTSRVLPPAESLSRLIVQNTVALPAAMFRKADVLATGGLDERLWYTADWDLWLRLAGRGPLAWSPERAVGFRLHGSSQTIMGSRDIRAFRKQLAIPLQRHGDRAPSAGLRLALVSNAVNCWLAERHHGGHPPLGPLLAELLSLGPRGMIQYLRASRLVDRVSARVRARL